jgi:hypothetical protein
MKRKAFFRSPHVLLRPRRYNVRGFLDVTGRHDLGISCSSSYLGDPQLMFYPRNYVSSPPNHLLRNNISFRKAVTGFICLICHSQPPYNFTSYACGCVLCEGCVSELLACFRTIFSVGINVK